jgi:uncharacterized HAD superfamily protein
MKNIVLDLDGVIADIAYGLDKVLKDKVDYSKWLIEDNCDQQALDIFGNPLFWKNLKPFEDAWHQVNYWFSCNYDVYVVTARRTDASMSNTETWLDSWRISTMRPIFTNIGEKHTVIKELNPVFVVEDNPNEIAILENHGINCYMRNAWYNQDRKKEFKNIDTLYELRIND